MTPDTGVPKSGGEWISSVALENALMGHPAAVDAVVFVREIPRTTAGKFLKRALREQYRDYLLAANVDA